MDFSKRVLGNFRLICQHLRPLRKRCAHCEKYFTQRRNEPQRSQRLFITAPPGVENNKVPLLFFIDQEF
jgi:hypothetical protein